MNFIEELKTRKDLIRDPENLVAVSGASLDEISGRLRNDAGYRREMEMIEQRKYGAQSSCANRF